MLPARRICRCHCLLLLLLLHGGCLFQGQRDAGNVGRVLRHAMVCNCTGLRWGVRDCCGIGIQSRRNLQAVAVHKEVADTNLVKGHVCEDM